MGGWDVVETFIDEVRLREFLSKFPSLSVSPWKKSNLFFSRATINVTTQNVCSI